MDSARAWRPSGDAKFSAAVVRRAASASPSACQTSTQAPDDRFDFPRRHRLTRGLDIQAVLREGKRIRTTSLDVRVLASPLGVSVARVGIIVPKHQQSAVDRNRLKRRLRELARLELLPSLRRGEPADVAIRARREAYQAKTESLRADVIAIRTRLRPEA